MSTVAYSGLAVQPPAWRPDEPAQAAPALPATPDPATIARALRLLARADQLVEIRALGVAQEDGSRRTISGYFDNALIAARAAATLSPRAEGVYVTLGEIDPALRERGLNHLRVARAGTTTADGDVRRLRWLFVDADPERPSGISATEAEHQAALERARAVRRYLVEDLGWPDVVVADSGNGGHVLARVDLDPADSPLLRRGLEALAARFDDAAVHIDRKTYNPARIDKLYGTLARKGEPTAERPHRRATLLHVPRTLEVTSRAQLEALASQAPQATTSSRGGQATTSSPALAPYDLAGFIARHGLDVAGPTPWRDARGETGERWVFRVCPWNPAHTNQSAYILRHASGAISAGCHHNGCAGNDWAALRARYEPPPSREAAELAALRAELAALRAERDEAAAQAAQARAELETTRAALDRAELSGAAETIRTLERQVRCERDKVRQIAGILERTELTDGQRVVTALAVVMGEAFRLPAEFGQEQPAPEPRRVPMAELERRAGISAHTAARALKPAVACGIITRVARAVTHTRADGTTESRTEVLIGPGNGQAPPDALDRRRVHDAERLRRARAERDAREAALVARVAELEAAKAEADTHGCSLCSGGLLPTGYFCPHCGVEHPVAELAARHASRATTSSPAPPQEGGGQCVNCRPIYRSTRATTSSPAPHATTSSPAPPADASRPAADAWLAAGDEEAFW